MRKHKELIKKLFVVQEVKEKRVVINKLINFEIRKINVRFFEITALVFARAASGIY